jgi:FtsP/CotA-like multicopper oxidase with cupredoxin domain
MHKKEKSFRGWAGIPAAAAMLLLLLPALTLAKIDGVTGTSFTLTAKSDHITTADGTTMLLWGYANGAGRAQYPGPTLIVTQGQPITVTLKNQLNVPVSIVFAGQETQATGGLPGLLGREALKADDPVTPVDESTVTYTFTPAEPGTYLYSSGTDPQLQVQMGLLGALIVRPATQNLAACPQFTQSAYGDCRSAYDSETLFLLTETDPDIHALVEVGRIKEVKTTEFFPVNWFINGRGAPDTLAPANASWLPTQPYDCFVRATPGGRVLLRMIGAGRDSHPFHTHGNNMAIIARDSRVLATEPGNPAAARPAEVGVVPDLAASNFTANVLPGGTYDAIFAWTGRELGWDMHAHALTAPFSISDRNGDGQSESTLATEVFAQTTVTADGGATLTLTGTAGFPTNHPFRTVIWAGPTYENPATVREVVELTPQAGGGNTFSARRALEGTTQQDWTAGGTVYMTDHGRKFPVILPDINSLFFGQFYSGSPFLGSAGALPPGEGGFNPNAGFFFMWHSHNEKELTNNDIFPGGMMTMFVVEPPGTPIE